MPVEPLVVPEVPVDVPVVGLLVVIEVPFVPLILFVPPIPFVPLMLFVSVDGVVMGVETAFVSGGVLVLMLTPPMKRLPAVNLPVQTRTLLLLEVTLSREKKVPLPLAAELEGMPADEAVAIAGTSMETSVVPGPPTEVVMLVVVVTVPFVLVVTVTMEPSELVDDMTTEPSLFVNTPEVGEGAFVMVVIEPSALVTNVTPGEAALVMVVIEPLALVTVVTTGGAALVTVVIEPLAFVTTVTVEPPLPLVVARLSSTPLVVMVPSGLTVNHFRLLMLVATTLALTVVFVLVSPIPPPTGPEPPRFWSSTR